MYLYIICVYIYMYICVLFLDFFFKYLYFIIKQLFKVYFFFFKLNSSICQQLRPLPFTSIFFVLNQQKSGSDRGSSPEAVRAAAAHLSVKSLMITFLLCCCFCLILSLCFLSCYVISFHLNEHITV